MKKEIAELVQYSTAYGVPNLQRSKRLFNKVLWTIFLITAVVCGSYYIYNDLVDYFNYEVVTTVKSNYDQPTEFPAVSFCSQGRNFFDGKQFSDIIRKDDKVGFDSDLSVSDQPANHFESFTSPAYGQCFRFNSGKNLSNHTIGIKN